MDSVICNGVPTTLEDALKYGLVIDNPNTILTKLVAYHSLLETMYEKACEDRDEYQSDAQGKGVEMVNASFEIGRIIDKLEDIKPELIENIKDELSKIAETLDKEA